MFGVSEIALLLIVVVLLVGARKLPELARNAGKAARILKSEKRAGDAEAREPRATYQVKEVRPLGDGSPAVSAVAADGTATEAR